ncbi:MAG: hypothetical protein WBK51_03550 [Polaromonas sp.]
MNAMVDRAQDRLPITRSVRLRLQDGGLSLPEPISAYSAIHAWVLIGDPGAGKTDAFKSLSQAEGGLYISARNFVELDQTLDQHSLVFIDGLDEISAGGAIGFTALGQIRAKLQKLGTPKFRISCREADWRGSTDSAALQRLVGEQDFLELHLAPLNRQESEALITHWQSPNAQRATDFIAEAEKKNLEGLLDNPQSLRLLVEATANGWPETKTQTYQMACAKLVQEHNDQWRANTREVAPPDEALLQAAGYLCALMLLSSEGLISLQKRGIGSQNTVALVDLPISDSAANIALCRAALHTRLFTGNGSGDFLPVHRTVAEFLAAQYLIKRVNEGLPYRRVLALMLGEDAGVVPELRGLHAWLAAIAVGPLRVDLIDRDPLGVVLNGDVQNFTHSEKLQVLDALSNEAKRYTYFRRQNWVSQPFGALATKDMESDFRCLLTSADRSPAHVALVDCILDAVAHGQGMQGLKTELEQIVRDASYWPSSRIEALRTLIAFERLDDQWPVCRKLLDDIHSCKVEDSEDELLGTLLSDMYPGHITGLEIWNYFRKPKASSLLGSYWSFWHDLPKKISIEEIAVLLDSLVSMNFKLENNDDEFGMAGIIGSLLVRGVTHHGLEMTPPDLQQWLLLGLGEHYYCPLDPEHKEALQDWLKKNPKRYKVLFEHAISIKVEEEKSGLLTLWQIQQQLYEAPEPADVEHWYLSLAEKCTHIEWRQQMVFEAFRVLERKVSSNVAIEMLEDWQKKYPDDGIWIDAFLKRPYPPDEQYQERIKSKLAREARTKERETQKVEFFQNKLPGFLGSFADLGALIEIGNAYLNRFHKSKGKSPETRLLELLNQNKEWLQLALHGLRQCLFRSDLPTADEIIKLNTEDRRYNLATPCLAAMELRWTEQTPADALNLSDSVLEMMVAFRLTNNFDSTPEWFKCLAITRADVMARVMSPLITTQIANKKEHVDGLYMLAHDPNYFVVAKLIVPDMLRLFPRKAQKTQLKSLRLLIATLIKNLDRATQLEIIANRLSDKPCDVAQRVYWLAAGLQLAPDIYLEPAKQYISQTQARVSHLIALVHEQRDRDGPQGMLPLAALEFMIELLGPQCSPSWAKDSGWVSPDMELGRYVEGFISTIAGMPGEDAQRVLDSLLQRKTLKPWVDHLRRALFDQQLTRRIALFKPETVTKVSATLANLTPANAADLHALTLDHLQQLGHEIRHGSTNDYLQYWREKKPQVEDSCRDRLLSDLKIRLNPLGISAEPEGRYADAKRADIKVSAQGYNIPIEIKREMHPDLWKAIEHQLIARYTRELASDGYGIFLVFWFGGAGQPVAGDGGTRPKAAIELQERLQQTVPVSHQHKITVLVIDCSLRPAGKG